MLEGESVLHPSLVAVREWADFSVRCGLGVGDTISNSLSFWEIFTGMGTTGLLSSGGGDNGLHGIGHDVPQLEGLD